MMARTHRWIVAASIVSLGVGAVLSHVIEPGVRVEKMKKQILAERNNLV
jgi:hypothetical protein